MEDIRKVIKRVLNEQTDITLEEFKKLFGLSPEFYKHLSYVYEFIKKRGYSFDELKEKNMIEKIKGWIKLLYYTNVSEQLSYTILEEYWDRTNVEMLKSGEMTISDFKEPEAVNAFEEDLAEMIKYEYNIDVYADVYVYCGTYWDTGVEHSPSRPEWTSADYVGVKYHPSGKIVITIECEESWRSSTDDYHSFIEEITIPYTKKYAVFPFDYKDIINAFLEKLKKYKDEIEITPSGKMYSDIEKYL